MKTQEELNNELSQMREKFIKDNNLSCDTCIKKQKTRCKSKTYCIVKDIVFNSSYVEKDNIESDFQ